MEQVADLVAPHPDTLKLFNSWLKEHGVPSSTISMTHGGSWLTVGGVRVSQANDLLGASYRLYRHTTANSTVLRTINYGLPGELHAHVRTVAPTTYFGSPRTLPQTSLERPRGVATVLSSRYGNGVVENVTPSYLRWLYKTADYVPAAASRNVLGIAGFLGDYPSPDDLTIFMNKYRAEGDDATYSVIGVHGGGYNPSYPNNPGLEASDNVQYAAAIAYPTSLIFYSTAHVPGYEDMYLNWLNYLLTRRRIPQTIFASYGAFEYDIPQELAESVCDLFAELALRGTTVIVTSGDDGVGPANCMDYNGYIHFLPNFPASCM